MFWNNRVIFHPSENPDHAYYAIHECFYEEGTGDLMPHSWTQDPISIIADNLDDMRETLNRMLRATERPVLVEKDDKLIEYKP